MYRVYKRFLTYIKHMRCWQQSNHNREMQLRYLTQSAQLEEAGNPWLVRVTMITASLFVLLFMVWAAVAQINEVTRATGEVIPDGFQQRLQHLEGGIIAEIMVKEGDIAEQGQPLLRLSEEGLKEDISRLQHQLNLLRLQEARLQAFVDGEALDLSHFKNVLAADIQKQHEMYRSMMASYKSEEAIIRQQIDQKKQDLSMANTQLLTVAERLVVLEESYQKRQTLHKEGYYPRVKLMETKDELIALQGRKTELLQLVEQSKSALIEFEEKLESLTVSQKNSALQQLEQLETEKRQNTDLWEKLNNRLKRLVVRSPVRGIVKGLAVNTIGGVIQPGQTIMEIIPLDSSLTVEIRIAPRDIGNLFVGKDVYVKVSAYDFARYGSIQGELSALSASTFTGEDGNRYYKGYVTLTKNYVGKVPDRNIIFPGMTVMADIVTGERSILAYLFKPIQSSIQTAFQEK